MRMWGGFLRSDEQAEGENHKQKGNHQKKDQKDLLTEHFPQVPESLRKKGADGRLPAENAGSRSPVGSGGEEALRQSAGEEQEKKKDRSEDDFPVFRRFRIQ